MLVECGTATTIDAVDSNGVHRGGWILPGRAPARQGLLNVAPGLQDAIGDTEKLHCLQLATDTEQAIERGLLLQQAGAVELALRSLEREMDRPVGLVFTGGEAEVVRAAVESAQKLRSSTSNRSGADQASRLESRLDFVTVEPDLVLKGLAMAIEHLK